MADRANVREFKRPIKEYVPKSTPVPDKVYFPPHEVGKPGECSKEFTDELFQGWFNCLNKT